MPAPLTDHKSDSRAGKRAASCYHSCHHPLAALGQPFSRSAPLRGCNFAKYNTKHTGIAMAKLGTEKKPIIVRVHTDEKARYVAEKCAEHGWHFIIGFEPDKPEDISDLEKMLNPTKAAVSTKVKRNDPCPCGSGKKYKKCCGGQAELLA
jgi:SWIM/SEC-C metal-binding protein